jgi:phosphoserine aminotransferase
MEQISRTKAGLLYDAMEASDGYYRSTVDRDSRSLMNVTFRLPDEDKEKRFLAEATGAGLVGLKGHRSVGGMRASLYNAMPMEGVERLVGFMEAFRKANP